MDAAATGTERGAMLTMEDKFEIVELSARFENAYDAQDVDAWLAAWTEDGVFDQDELEITEGRNALGQWFETFQKTFYGKRYEMFNYVVEGKGEGGARMYCYPTIFERAQGPMVWGTTTFDDVLREVDGRWLFAYRKQRFDPVNTKGPGAYLFG